MSETVKSVFSCRKVSGGVGRGKILRSSSDICFFMTDPASGILQETGHDLSGLSVAGKVLVFPSGKGSAVVQDEGLFALKETDNLPSAMIIERPDTVLVFGALLLEIPVVDSADSQLYEQLKNGDEVCVDADKGVVSIGVNDLS